MSKDKERQLSIHHQSHQYIESPYLPSIEAEKYESLKVDLIMIKYQKCFNLVKL